MSFSNNAAHGAQAALQAWLDSESQYRLTVTRQVMLLSKEAKRRPQNGDDSDCAFVE